MDEGNDFMELMELQGNLAMVTKSELLDALRKHGQSISDRQLTSFASEGLMPKSARIGSRGGAYPRIVIDLLWFILRLRKQGLSVNGIKELLPLWRYLRRALRDKEVSLAEFELIARQTITLQEAWFAVPGVLMEVLPCPMCTPEELAELTVILKDGTPCLIGGDDPVSIGFVIGIEEEDTGKAYPHFPMRIAIPRDDEGFNTSSIVLGIPVGVPLERRHHSDELVELTTGPSANDSTDRVKEEVI